MEYLFSICIPTYNRVSDLGVTLNSIVSQNSFDDEVEVVVVDNASTDATETIMLDYCSHFSNIKYIRNTQNIGADRNIIKAFLAGHGRYIKILNDNKYIKPGVIRNWKYIFSIANQAVVFHYPGRGRFVSDCFFENSPEEFFMNISYNITWLGGISINREMLNRVNTKDLNYSSFLVQTELLCKLIIENKTSMIVYSDWFEEPAQIKRSGYNYFLVFNNNYIVILKEMVKIGILSRCTMDKMKRDLLYHHTFITIVRILFDSNNYSFSTDKALYYLYKNFGACIHLYLFPLWLFFWSIKKSFSFLKENCE